MTENTEDGMARHPDDDPVTAVHRAAAEALVGGPMALGSLAHSLRDCGLLAPFDDDLGREDDDDRDDDAALVDEILLESDDIWVSDDGMVAAVSQMLDGAVFSRRVTERELAYGLLNASPDLERAGFRPL